MSVSYDSRVLKLELSVVRKLTESIDTPRALTVYLLIKYEEWDQLVALDIDPDHYDNHQSFSDDYLVTSILQKSERLPTTHSRYEVAIGKFRASEARCAETNRRLGEFCESPHSAGAEMLSVISNSQRIIQSILGAKPGSRDLAFAESNMRFGPGATTSLSGVVSQGKKYSHRTLDVTPRLLPFRAFCFPDLWKESAVEVRTRASSKLVTVPKNAKTDRVICIEPDLNIFVQLGIGALLREKLLRSGLDLRTQETNRTLAQQAYELDLATVDLASASDTISREAVWLLLPFPWASLLHLARVDKTLLGEEEIVLEKWSSMGNGYTFELETLIFWAVTRSVCEVLGIDGPITVYGDDIICPSGALELLRKALDFLGFSVNTDKTFGKGSFRESCGADFFKGHSVRPIFFRSQHHDFASVCYLYANNLRRWSCRRNGGSSCDIRLLPAWLACYSAVEPRHRHSIPDGVGDVGFIADFDRACPTVPRELRSRGWAGYQYHYRYCKPVEKVISPFGGYLASLRAPTDFRKGVEGLRGRFSSATTENGYTLVWPNLGPWL